MSDLVGQTISHYEILGPLGSGAMGMVYKAHDLKLDRTVALKFLPPDLSRDADAKTRFLHEARASSSLLHKNICLVYDVDDTDDGRMFISMECIEGQTLMQRIEQGSLPIAEAVSIAAQIAAGLAKAHEAGIVHRDLKPANIMIARDDAVKILDFGLAKSRAGSVLTMPGTLLGTVAYMSPEQARGDPVDQRTDVWSLGVILYEMLAGNKPFRDEYAHAVMYAIINEEHASPLAVRPDIPLWLEKVIDRCLAKNPGDRFRDGGELLQALQFEDHKSTNAAEAAPKPLRVAIAVLPFADISPDKDNKYFSDGLTEEIIAKLSRLQHVKIVSLNSVLHYERAGKTTRQIAGELAVQYLLEGSVRKHGNSLRITTHLIDAGQDAYLWAETYTGTMDEIFDIQEDVAKRIVKALKVRLTPSDRRTLKRRATENTGAYQLYLKGRFFWSKRTKDALLTAIRYFEEAIQADPRFAPAWAGIADAHIILADMPGMPRTEAYAKAKEAANRALAIDDGIAEAHASLGLLAMLSEWDWLTAEKEHKLALRANPNYGTAHHWYAEWLSLQGRAEEAIAESSRAVELDPLSPAVLKDKGMVLYYARDYDGAIEYARKSLEVDPGFPLAHRILSLAYQAKGMGAEALAEHELWEEESGGGPEERAARAYCYAATGRKEEAEELLRRLQSSELEGGNLARGIALVYVALGDHDSAFAWLEKAYRAKAEAMSTLVVDPKLDPLRADPRFTSLLQRVGLAH